MSVDFDRSSGRSGRNALSLVTYYRFHRMLRPLLSLNSNPTGALLEAVINQDEYAVALLLQYPQVGALLKPQSSSPDSKAFELSQRLNNPILIEIFKKTYAYWNITIPYTTEKAIGETLSDGDDTIDSHVELGNGGYPATLIQYPALEIRRDADSITTTPTCRIPRIRLSTLNAQSFRTNHVMLASPAILVDDVGLLESEFKRSNFWSRNHMQTAFGSEAIAVSRIPYSSIFSIEEVRSYQLIANGYHTLLFVEDDNVRRIFIDF